MRRTYPPGVIDAPRWLPPFTAVLAVLGALFGLAVLPGPPGSLVPALTVGVVAQLAATAVVHRFRMSAPHLGMAAVTVVAALLFLLGSPWRPLLIAQGVPWVPVMLAWATILAVDNARTPRQLRIAAAFAFLYPLAAGLRQMLDGDGPSALSTLAAAAAPILGGLAIGLAGRLRRARRDRVAALARERAEVARRARDDERQRLAAEIHDSLGHVLTLLVLQANALTVTTTDHHAQDAARRMSRLGTDGLTELRQLLQLLSPPERATPAVAALVDDARAAGQDVLLDLTGDVDGLPPVLARILHQVVREGLTNARRHAPGATTKVRVAVGDDVHVVVLNGPGGSDPGPGTGRGLAAVRHNVAVLGGICEHAPTDDGGYALRISLPAGSAEDSDDTGAGEQR